MENILDMDINSNEVELRGELARLRLDYETLKQSHGTYIAERKVIDEEIRTAKEFSEKILESLPGIFYLYTYPALRLVRWNKNHETLLGFTAEEIRNRYIMDWHIPEAKPLVQQAVDYVIEQGQNVLESPLLNKDGEYIPFLMTGVRIEIQGQLYLMGFGIDIRDRLKMEQSQKESDSLFRLLAENSTDMIARHDEMGNFMYVSPACKTLLGYDPEDMIGHSAFEFIHPEDQMQIEASRQKIVDSQAVSTTTFRIRCKDGHYIWFETISRSIYDPVDGHVLELHASSRDITARKLSEFQLRESEQKFSTLFGTMTEMVALHDLVFDKKGEAVNYRITDINDAYTKITGIQKINAVGRLATDVYGTDTAPYLQEFRDVALTGKPYEYTTYFAPLDKHFMISVVSPSPNRFATITTDITDIQQIQQSLSDKNKELENYLYVASHDLRSPLVNIQGFSLRLQKQIDQLITSLPQLDEDTQLDREAISLVGEGIPKTLSFIYSNVAKMDNLNCLSPSVK